MWPTTQRQRPQLASRCPPDAPVAARTGPGRRDHPRDAGLLGLSFRTDASIDRVEAGRLLDWHAHDRQKQLRGSRLVEPTGPPSCRFTEVVEVHLLGRLRPWSGWWRGCSNGRPPPTSDASNTC
jgi:hypothetical protein